MGFNPQPPDPKAIVDSIGKGASELLTFIPRAAKNIAENRTVAAADLKDIGRSVQDRLPDNPGVLLDATIKAVGSIVKRGIGMAEGIVGAADETAKGVKTQIDKILK